MKTYILPKENKCAGVPAQTTTTTTTSESSRQQPHHPKQQQQLPHHHHQPGHSTRAAAILDPGGGQSQARRLSTGNQSAAAAHATTLPSTTLQQRYATLSQAARPDLAVAAGRPIGREPANQVYSHWSKLQTNQPISRKIKQLAGGGAGGARSRKFK